MDSLAHHGSAEKNVFRSNTIGSTTIFIKTFHSTSFTLCQVSVGYEATFTLLPALPRLRKIYDPANLP